MLRLFSICLISLGLIVTPAFATIEIKEDGTSKGYVKRIDFINGPTVTRSGISGTVDMSGVDAPSDADYLVGTANANLSAEIVVGTSEMSLVNLGSTLVGGSATTADLSLKTTSGVGTSGADMHFLVGNNGATEAMTILNNGNVGIGTTSPATQLEIEDASTAPTIRLDNSGGANSTLIVGDSNRTGSNQSLTGLEADWNGTRVALVELQTGNDTTNKDDGEIAFWTAAAGSIAEAMRIDNAGNVGIGTASPTGQLDVAANDASGGQITVRSLDTGIGSANELGSVLFTGDDDAGGDAGTGFVGAKISADVPAAWSGGTNDYPADLVFYTNPDGTSALAERMRIDNGGNVGIGDAGPDYTLEVLDATGPQLALTHTDTTYHATFDVAADGLLTITTLDTAAAEADVVFSPDGNVGIKTVAPATDLDVFGDIILGGASKTAPSLQINGLGTGGVGFVDIAVENGTADWDTRLIRNTGAAGTMDLLNRGGGLMRFGTDATANLVTFSSTGEVAMTAGQTLFMGGLLDVAGAVDMDIGSGDVTDVTVTTDGGTTVIDGSIDTLLADATTNAVADVLILDHTGGTPAAGFGSGIRFDIEDAGGSEEQASIDVSLDVVTDASEEASIIFRHNVAGTMTETMRLDGTAGNVGINQTAPDATLDILPVAGDTKGFELASAIGGMGTVFLVSDTLSGAGLVFDFVGDSDGDDGGAHNFTMDKDGNLSVPETLTQEAGETIFMGGLLDATGAVDMDYGSGDITDHTFTTDGGVVILDGDITQDAGTTLFMGGLLDATGDVDMDYGSADIDDHTFTTDGTGTAEFVVPAGSIDSTEILDATIAIGDLAAGTDGELITWDASGNAATVAVGTAAQVLTSNGAGAAPTFQAAAGGGIIAQLDGTVGSTSGPNTTSATYIDLDELSTGITTTTGGLFAVVSASFYINSGSANYFLALQKDSDGEVAIRQVTQPNSTQDATNTTLFTWTGLANATYDIDARYHSDGTNTTTSRGINRDMMVFEFDD